MSKESSKVNPVKQVDKNKDLLTELGELTFKRAKMQIKLNENAKRANEIGAILEKAEKNA